MTKRPSPKQFLFLTLGCLLGISSLSAEDTPAGKNETKRETKVLWDFKGCEDHRLMNRVYPYVYKGNAYLYVFLPGLKTMIVKVPLDGGEVQMVPLMPGHTTGDDPHRYYAMHADSKGFFHITGDMHSSPYVKHWISKRPEDISEFVSAAGKDSNKGPQGANVTYPSFFQSPDGVLYHSIRCSTPVWGVGISVLDVKTQTWSMLGADVPGSAIAEKGRAKHANGNPLTAWEDNGEGHSFGYMQPHAQLRWDKDKRMHFTVCLLNENTPPSFHGGHTGSDVLYAYSDDGGKTFHRGDGAKILLPMRADPGPNQADVVYSRHDGPPPWVGLMPKLSIDKKNRPVVKVLDHKTGYHSMVLEKGKWTELQGDKPSDEAAKGADDEDEDVEDTGFDRTALKLPENAHLSFQYFHKTGDALYTDLPNRRGDKGYNRIKVVLSRPVQTATAPISR